ncbi:MAG: hypothetical protein IJ383_04405 [Bacteroidales bacterium]|nr:hypothetical protein [Bacteroidales bacterium]
MKNCCAFVAILYALLICNCAFHPSNAIVVIDLNKEYPEVDLALSDIADVSFIPLSGGDSVAFRTNMHGYDNSIFIDSNYLFIADYSPIEYDEETKTTTVLSNAAHLHMFEPDGDYIRTVVKPGMNENEFLGWGMNFTVHPNHRIISIHNVMGTEVKFFDYLGNYKGSYNLGKRYHQCISLNDIVLFVDYYSQFIASDGTNHENGRTLMFYDIETNISVDAGDLPVSPFSGKPEYSTRNKIVRTCSGAYWVTPRTDTIYHIDNNLQITPRFISLWNGASSDNCVIPIVETQEYIIFSNDIDYVSEYKGNLKLKTYLLRKQDNKLFAINSHGYNSDGVERSIFKNEILMGNWATTQTPNTLAYMLTMEFIRENYEFIPDKLKHIACVTNENNSHILMVIRFKESLKHISEFNVE